MNSHLEIGSVVSLRSGGKPMTIKNLDGESASCVWFDKTNRLQNAEFPVQVLRPCDGEFDGVGTLIIEGVTHTRAEIDQMTGASNAQG